MSDGAPTVRLAHKPGSPADNNLLGARGMAYTAHLPAILVSFVYLRLFEKYRASVRMRDWALDSGAFSAKHLGIRIDLQEYIETCKRLQAADPLLVEVFALDVIDDWRAGLRNTETMWKAGLEAIPAYHIGEPVDVLLGLARDYPKIALGGVARLREGVKLEFAKQCFARVWPKRIHGFGFGARRPMMELPFHSTDASSWQLGPCRYGNWATYGKMSVRGSKQDLRVEIDYFLAIERDARRVWAKEMARLGEEAAA